MLISNQEKLRYQKLQDGQAQDWEARCCSCGMCCGVKDGDPCEELVLQDSGQYRCKVYYHRFGIHKTKSGRSFPCVPIRHILHEPWPGGERCRYKQMLKDFCPNRP